MHTNYFLLTSELNLKIAAHSRDVALRRRAEQIFVIAAEVCRVFVADAETGARGVKPGNRDLFERTSFRRHFRARHIEFY